MKKNTKSKQKLAAREDRQTDENNEMWHAARSGSPFDLVAE